MDLATWNDWWRSRGEDRLALLLWALWNPIGPVPLDEYAGYVGPVVAILKGAQEIGPSLSRRPDDGYRNQLWATSVEELASHLARVRETMMEVPLDPEVERNAAEVLLDWYEEEMKNIGG